MLFLWRTLMGALGSLPVLGSCVALGMIGNLCRRPLKFDYVLSIIGMILNQSFFSMAASALELFLVDEIPNEKCLVKSLPEMVLMDRECTRLCQSVLGLLLAQSNIHCFGGSRSVDGTPIRFSATKFPHATPLCVWPPFRLDRWWWAVVRVRSGCL